MRDAIVSNGIDPMSYALPGPLAAAVEASLAEWQADGKAQRLWRGDPSLWSGRDEGQWLGWLAIADGQLADTPRFARIAEVASSGAFSDVVLLGVGRINLRPVGDARH